MKQTKKGGRRPNVSMKEWNSVYPDPVTQSSMIGRYSRYPGIIFIIALLAGLAAGFPSTANAIISFKGYTGSAAGWVWLWFTILTAGLTLATYLTEKGYERSNRK